MQNYETITAFLYIGSLIWRFKQMYDIPNSPLMQNHQNAAKKLPSK